MLEWKIYYGDGTSYSNESGPLELAPKTNVQGIAVADELVGRRLERDRDFYIYSPERGGWRAVDRFAYQEYMMEHGGAKIVLFGRLLPDDEYRRLLDMMTHDPELPPKSGYLRGERR